MYKVIYKKSGAVIQIADPNSFLGLRQIVLARDPALVPSELFFDPETRQYYEVPEVGQFAKTVDTPAGAWVNHSRYNLSLMR